MNPEASAAIASGRKLSMDQVRWLAALPVDAVNTEPVHTDPVNTSSARRRAYRREWMAMKRERERQQQP